MQITQITVNAGRTLQHPCETYANIRPSVTLVAALAAGDDPAACVRDLQRQAEQMVEEHAMVLRASLAEREVAKREEQELARLNASVADNQQRIELLKESVERRQLQPSGFLFDASADELGQPQAAAAHDY